MPAGEPWDLVVIGGGSAGLVASKTAAGFGARVLLIEREHLGGDCLWTGCVPSKALISSAHEAAANDLARDARRAAERFPATMARVREAVATIAPVDSAEAIEASGVSVMLGDAAFTSPSSLTIDGVTVRFRQAVIATGSSPTVPDIPGIATVDVLTSDTFWQLDELPERLVILGGGAIGCELGQAMARHGSHVTIVQRSERILPREEPRASAIVRAALETDGIAVLTGRVAASVESADGVGGTLILDDGSRVDFDRLVVALGRSARGDRLRLDLAGVRTDAAGYVAIDRALRTSNPRIRAAGDASGLAQFTHLAGVNGSIAASNAILGLRRSYDERVVPRVTFTSPEVAAVGIQAAQADPRRHRVVTWNHTHSDRAITDADSSGYTQIVVDRAGRILGGTIVSPRAGETVGELTLAVKQRLSTSVLAGTTHAYPTFNDPLWNAAVADVRHRLSRGPVAFAIRMLVALRALAMRRA